MADNGIGVPAPAQYNSPSNPPGSQTRGTAMVVIQSVDNALTPKYANVLVADKTPAEAGYAIPIGMGPWTVGGISTTSTTAVTSGSTVVTPISMAGISVGDTFMCSNSDNTNPELVTVTAVTTNTFTANFTSGKSGTWNIKSGGFTYNNSSGLGGALMLADLDERVIKSGPYGVSNVAPTPYYSAIADHKHDGNLNPGGYLNPNPIDTGQLMTMPSNIKNAGPNVTGASLGTPVATSNSVVHQPFTVSIGDWTPGSTPLWFTCIRVYKRAHGDTHVVPVGSLPPQTGVTWNYAVDLGVGSTGWDIGLSYVDTASFESTIVWPAALSNIDNPTTMGIIPSMPSGATISASTVTTTVFDNGKPGVSSPNLLQPVIQTQFTLVETNNPDASQWGAQFIAYVRKNGTSSWQSQSQAVLPASAFTNGSVHTVYVNVTDGNNYDIGVLLADQQGNLTNNGTPVVLATNVSVANAIIGNPRMQQMPSTVLTNGPTISTSSLVARTVLNGTSQVVKVNFTETDFTTLPDWIDGIWIVLRKNGTTDATNHKRIDPSSSTTGAYTGSMFCGTGDTIDVGVFYTDKKGQQSAVVWPTGLVNNPDPNGDFSDPTTGTIKHARHSGPVTATIDPAAGGDGSYLGAGKVYGRHLSGAPSSDTGALSDNTGKLLHTRHSSGVQSALDSTGNILNVEFPSGKLQTDGSLTNVDGASSATKYTLATGQNFSVSADIVNATGTASSIILGNRTNGYELRMVNQTGTATTFIKAWVAGAATNIVTGPTFPFDSNYHSYRLTITPGSPNTIEGSIDGHTFGPITDSSLTLTSGTWPVTVYTGGATGTMQHFSASAASFHRTGVHNDYLSTVKSGGGIDFASNLHANKTLDNIGDTSTYAKVKSSELSSGTVNRLNDGTNIRTAAHVAGAIDTSSRVIGNIFDGTTALTPANFTNAITNAGLVKVANATGILPRGNTHGDFTSTVNAGGGVNFGVAGHTGTLPRANTHSSITSAISATQGSDGSWINSTQISRRHFTSFGTGTNLLFNANGAQNLQGWNIFGTPGGTSNWNPDSYAGGRFHCARSGSTAAADYLLYQQFTITYGGNVTAYGLYELNNLVLGGGGGVWVDLYDTTSGTILASSTAITANTSSTPWTVSASTTAGHVLQLRLRTQFQTGDAFFYKPKLEYGTTSTPFDDAWTSGIVPLTHDSSGNLDVSRTQSGKILPYANHGTAFTNVIDSSSNIYNHPVNGLFISPYGETVLPTNGAYFSGSNIYFGAQADSGFYGACRVKVNTTGLKPGYNFNFHFGSSGSRTGITTGYVVELSTDSGGNAEINCYKVTGGTFTALGGNQTTGLGFGDGNFHSLRIWASNVSGTGVQIYVTFDGQIFNPYTDSAATYLQGQWGFANNSSESVYVLQDIDVQVAGHLHQAMPYAVRTVVTRDPGGDGSHLAPGTISGRHFAGGNSGDNGAMVDSSSKLLHSRHSSFVQSAIDSTGSLTAQPKNLLYNGGFSIMPASGTYPSGITSNKNGAIPNPATDDIPGWEPFVYGIRAGDSATVYSGAGSGGGQFDQEKSDPYTFFLQTTTTSASTWTGAAQRVHVTPAQWLAFRGWVYIDNLASCHIKLCFFKSDGTTSIGSGTASSAGTGVGINNCNANWSSNVIFLNGGSIGWSQTTGGNSGWCLVYAVFQVPSDAYWLDFMQMAGWVASGNGQPGHFYLDSLMLVTGQVPMMFAESVDDFTLTHPTYQANFNSSGNWNKSSSFKNVLPCFQPYTTDANITVTFNSGSAPYTAYYAVYGASGVATNCTFYNPDNTTQSAPYLGTSTTNTANMINSGYSTSGGSTVYYMVYYKPGDTSGINGTGWHVSFQGTQYTATQIKSAYQDGGYIAVVASASGGGLTASSGGTSTSGGCPEEHQIIERLNSLTGEVEYVEARQLRQGDFLRDPIDQCWNKILKPVTISDAQIWEVTIAGETVKVDASHLFMDAEDKWVNVQTLKVGHKMHVYPGDIGEVEAIRCIGPGRFVHISCERMRYVLGKTVSHNVKQK